MLNDTQLYLSFWPDDPTVAARISGCLADISALDWKKTIYSSTWQRLSFLLLPATPTLQHDFTIQLGSSIPTYPISFGHKSWCNLRWPADLQRAHCKDCSILQVCTTQHQKDQALSDRSMLHNFWSRALAFLDVDYCNALLAGLPSKHNQPSTNDSECSSTTGLQRAQKSPWLLLSLSPCTGYQLQLRIQFKTLMLDIEQPTGSAPTLLPLTITNLHSPPEVWDLLRERRSVVPSQRGSNHSPEHFSFTFLAGGMIFPSQSGCWIL